MRPFVAVLGLSALLLPQAPTPCLAREPSTTTAPPARWVPDRGSYPLDMVPRTPPSQGRCPEVPTSAYRGTTIRFERSARVYDEMIPRIARLEQIVHEVATETYGRAPRRLLHAGAYNCRSVRGYPQLLSEHGLGNAFDVRGFEFGPAARGSSTDLPRPVRRAFTVNVERHWHSDGTQAGNTHALFWSRLRARLEAEPMLFRGMLGPSYPGHHNHLHFDMAPWTLHHF